MPVRPAIRPASGWSDVAIHKPSGLDHRLVIAAPLHPTRAKRVTGMTPPFLLRFSVAPWRSGTSASLRCVISSVMESRYEDQPANAARSQTPLPVVPGGRRDRREPGAAGRAERDRFREAGHAEGPVAISSPRQDRASLAQREDREPEPARRRRA